MWNRTCSDDMSCPNTDGTVETREECQCGSVSCRAGQYCDASLSTCSDEEASPYDPCAGAVDGLCCEESFRGSRRRRLGATRAKGVSMQRVVPMASAPDA